MMNIISARFIGFLFFLAVIICNPFTIEQIFSPVQWTRCIQAMIEDGASQLVECGPGKVLSGLNRRIDKSLLSFSLEEPQSLQETREELA